VNIDKQQAKLHSRARKWVSCSFNSTTCTAVYMGKHQPLNRVKL